MIDFSRRGRTGLIAKAAATGDAAACGIGQICEFFRYFNGVKMIADGT
jgi:hypothetical protein